MPEKKKNEVSENVIQGNSISRAFYKMDVNEQRLATFSMYKLEKVEHILGIATNMATGKQTTLKVDDYIARFSVQEMCDVMGLEYNDDTKHNFQKSLDKLPSRTMTIDDEKCRETLPFIIRSKWNKQNQEVEITFNPYFFTAIFDALHYSKGNLQIFGALKKHASQRLYFYLLSYRNMQSKYSNPDGIWEIKTTIKELRKMFNLKDDEIARNNDFVRRYIKETCAEINKHNFEFSVDYKTSGKPTTDVVFTCCEKLNLKQLPPNDCTSMRQDAIEINNEKKLIQKYKQKYADEWQEVLKEKMQTQFFDFGFTEESKMQMIEHDVLKELQERHAK